MNTDYLLAFIKTADYKNMTQAAQSLYITQQALSRQIAVLEEELGVTLFFRGKNLELTPEGQQVYQDVTSIMNRYQRMLQFTMEKRNELHGTLRIGIHPVLTSSIRKYLRDFSNKHPLVQLLFHVAAPENLSQLFKNGELDTILLGKHTLHETREIRKLDVFKNRLQIIVAPDSPFAKYEEISLSQLKEEPFCFYPRSSAPDSIDRQIWLCHTCGFSPRIEYRASSAEELWLFVTLGKGVAFTSSLESSTMRDIHPIVLLESQDDDYYDIACFYKDTELTPELNSFLQLFSEQSE